jgi:hypothetical protein
LLGLRVALLWWLCVALLALLSNPAPVLVLLSVLDALLTELCLPSLLIEPDLATWLVELCLLTVVGLLAVVGLLSLLEAVALLRGILLAATLVLLAAMPELPPLVALLAPTVLALVLSPLMLAVLALALIGLILILSN